MKRISIINDEISDNLKEAVSFLKKHNLNYVELRSVSRKNIIDISINELKEYARYFERNKIKVSCIASPVLKGYPRGIKVRKYKNLKADTFYHSNKTEDPEKIFKIAEIFSCKYIRIFTFSRYKNFKIEHLDKEMSGLLKLAEKYDKTLLIENEPVCNINTLSGLSEIIKRYGNKRLKVLLDIGNLYSSSQKIDEKELSTIKKFIKYVHLKDYSFTQRKFVALGQGDINYKKHLSVIGKNMIYSLETHTGKNRPADSSISLSNLRNILGKKRAKYGIVGCGRVFSKHANAIKHDEQAELIGVFDINKTRMEKAAWENDCLGYKSLKELVESVDIVNVCTPHDTHASIVSEILRSGKKCLCEKPGSLNKNDAQKIRKSKNYGKNLFVVYQNRFNGPILKAGELIKQKNLGRLLYIFGNVRWFRDKDYYQNGWQGKKRKEGGVLFNQGIHIIDVVLNLADSGQVKIINAFKDKIYHKNIETEDVFLAQVRLGKAVFNLEVIAVTLPCNLESTALFIFENGRIRIGGFYLNEFLEIHLRGEKKKTFYYGENGNDHYGGGHAALIKKISEYVLSGKRDKNLVGFDEAFKRTEFINMLYKAEEKR